MVSPARRPTIRAERKPWLLPNTQTMYLRAMREFTRFPCRSPDTATPEDLRAFQFDKKEHNIGAPTFNNQVTVLSFLLLCAFLM